MGLAKKLLSRSFETGLHDMFAFEGSGQALAMSSSEFKEGLRAATSRVRDVVQKHTSGVMCPHRRQVYSAAMQRHATGRGANHHSLPKTLLAYALLITEENANFGRMA